MLCIFLIQLSSLFRNWCISILRCTVSLARPSTSRQQHITVLTSLGGSLYSVISQTLLTLEELMSRSGGNLFEQSVNTRGSRFHFVTETTHLTSQVSRDQGASWDILIMLAYGRYDCPCNPILPLKSHKRSMFIHNDFPGLKGVDLEVVRGPKSRQKTAFIVWVWQDVVSGNVRVSGLCEGIGLCMAKPSLARGLQGGGTYSPEKVWALWLETAHSGAI